jgi:uncharacterized membrane protein YeaQ/YmgE (transglycosylase-associated protein family)
MGILSWILLGAVAAWAISLLTRRTGPGDYLANGVVGFLGALAGGFAANLVGRDPVFGFTLISFFVAILGSAVFLAVFSALRQR